MELNKLCSTPDFHRDGDWERNFLDALAAANVSLNSEEIQQGPDGWPYLYISTAGEGEANVSDLVGWLSEKGVGLVVNPTKEIPDYVFPYGMIWNYRERGLFLESYNEENPGQVVFEESDDVMVGPPSREFLPDYVANVLMDFFNQQEVKNPKMLLVSKDGKHYDLCFSVESLGDPPEAEYNGILEAIAWFLPSHYSLMLISENGLPDFYELNDFAGREE